MKRNDIDNQDRRRFIAAAGGAAMALLVAGAAAGPLLAAGNSTGEIVETSAGRIRGRRQGGVSAFLGVPYGGDARKSRFRPPLPAAEWSGVRDCTAFAAKAMQGIMAGMPDLSASMSAETLPGLILAIARDTAGPTPESEDCLTLNVFTPGTMTGRRPVMVWLHGGGFAIGTASSSCFDGSAISVRGDVVVVTVNHRLNAFGYLYLGDAHPDYADSGNVGMLDIIQALAWVRDNIDRFGGDPNNVTIFGESGGGMKVAALLAMPAAHGLFHKAIQQSGSMLRAVDHDDAAELGARTLAALGIAPRDVHRLDGLDARTIIAAASAQESAGGPSEKRLLYPCIDGRSMPRHPFDPTAPAISRDVPLLIGTNRDEGTMFLAADPLFGSFTSEQARERFGVLLGDKGPAAFELYRSRHPEDAPTYWITALMTDQMMWLNSVREAELKVAQNAAPTFMYRLDRSSEAVGGVLRAMHIVDLPLIFGNFSCYGGLIGDGPAQRALSARMMQAWINFARYGNPSQPGLPWPAYDVSARRTMLFNDTSRIVADPDRPIREFFAET